MMCGYWTQAWDDITFFSLLALTSKACDPRDKVFGVLGFSASYSDPEGSVFFHPDYSFSPEDLYTALA